ncbi:MAG: cupin domain-containing protein [Desulfobulbaceae bacterium]|jgi:quercetin dioxygenase-like cupin family protein|nr:cupin domain-containing protein [Desulfobulbaceae bacterium]HKJ15710.1 cupin domain-containing protein [Desulfobulbales bacterium]MDH3775482.1 cupin domain-containing protein [Desulfobulbaceae bacterium]MDH3781763.1 cupin domain-containing protein [Desulfobulbaceae bacterium]MDH3866835.1 cupin domain-containing protein [Desulfobulbaceae bacterium]
METKFYPQREMIFTKHPVFDNVKAAMFITSKEANMACVCLIEIAPGSETPIHKHEEQADSVFVVQGHGETYVNGSWQPIEPGDYLYIPVQGEHGTRNTGTEPLRLFVHHSPPLV